MADNEIDVKRKRVGEFLDRHKLDGVLLRLRANFAWITGGKENYIPNNSAAGVASILATRDSLLCLTSNIEQPRIEREELAGTGIKTVGFPWYDTAAAAKVAHDMIGGKKIAADVDHTAVFGSEAAHYFPLSPDFNELRWSLTEQEIARYRDGGQRASAAMERACRQLKSGMSEFEIAGILDHDVRKSGSVPVVTLIASDERVRNFRHPIPTARKAQNYVMLVTCASFGGLISNLTRFVAFGSIPDDLKRRHQAVCNVDAAVNLATKPGRTLGEIFGDLQAAYAANGFPDEWKLHHQGGSTGYNGRDVFALPDSHVMVRENQAFAWNPSITGTKNEDTVLCTNGGIEVLTAPSKDWPTVTGKCPGGELRRADMLVL